MGGRMARTPNGVCRVCKRTHSPNDDNFGQPPPSQDSTLIASAKTEKWDISVLFCRLCISLLLVVCACSLTAQAPLVFPFIHNTGTGRTEQRSHFALEMGGAKSLQRISAQILKCPNRPPVQGVETPYPSASLPNPAPELARSRDYFTRVTGRGWVNEFAIHDARCHPPSTGGNN